MRFFKYEGLGNDFILIPGKPCWTAKQVQDTCDRHLGVGADGVIFVFEENKEWQMKVVNADGSAAEMCGNGIRCVAQWLFDQGYSVKQIMTDAGLKEVSRCDEAGNWSVDMGIASVNGNRVSLGNPHLVIQGPVDRNQIDKTVNTEFVQVKTANEIEVTVFERGVGETLACGTGACAAVALLVSQNQLAENKEILVHLKGGNLYITVHQGEDGFRVRMKGPARFVFEGEV